MINVFYVLFLAIYIIINLVRLKKILTFFRRTIRIESILILFLIVYYELMAIKLTLP